MARNTNNEFVTIEEIKPIIENADMVKNINKTTSENNSVNESDNNSISESENDNINAYIIANKKPKFEELHKKDTFWIKNEILEKLHGITKGNKGLKTQIINDSLELFFKKNKI
jgi:hypothetical protein